MMQGKEGRDHNPYGFSVLMAGGGIKGGKVIGATDDIGFRAVEDKVHIHDLHATMLELLGLDHRKLHVYRVWSGKTSYRRGRGRTEQHCQAFDGWLRDMILPFFLARSRPKVTWLISPTTFRGFKLS